MISRRMNQCVFWMMFFVCGVCAVRLGAGPPEEPACGNSCQLITYFQTSPTSIYGFASGGCLRIWVDSPNTQDPQGDIESTNVFRRVNPTCATHCPEATTGDVVAACTYAGTLGTQFVQRNCYVDFGALKRECVQQ